MKYLAVALLVACLAGSAMAASQQTVEEHDAAIAEVAASMPEHSDAFAEMSAAAGTADVFAVLDAISANIAAEHKHAEVFYRSYHKTTARDIRKYKLMIARLGGSERRSRASTKAERHEAKQLRRQINGNVRTLSRAVARFQHIQGEERRTTHKKHTAMRHLNNKIADRKTYLKVLRLIRQALADTSKPTGARFIEALAVAHQSGLGSSAAAPTVFLQLAEEDAEAVEQTTDSEDEAEADAEIDAEAFAMEDMPVASELELVAEEEDEDVAEEEADEAMDAADEAEEEETDEIEAEEEGSEDAEAEADAEDEVDSASEERMMQVLEQLATGARDDASIAELLTLIDSLIADVRESIASAKKRKVGVLAKYTAQMKNLQELANSIKATIRRLQVAVQNGRARLATLETSSTSVEASSKENDAQVKAYRNILKGLKANWAKYEARYRKNQAKRQKQIEQLAELKRRLAAIEREKGSLGIDLSAVNLRYRWKAYPFGACQAACGPSKRQRKVKCLSFSGKPVKHTFCDGQKKPKTHVKCQKKLCPTACIVSEWRPRGKCSNKCGTGVRLHTRKVVEPARFGGSCPQQFRLHKHKACKSLRGCKPGQAETAQTSTEAKAALQKRRELKQQEKVAGALQKDAQRAAALQRRNEAAALGAQSASAVPNRRVLTPDQQRKRAKNARCRACRKGKAGGACRFKNCLTKAQKLACKKCRKGKAGKKCRERKCKGPAKARRHALKKAHKAREAAKKAAAAGAVAAPKKPAHKRGHKLRKCLKKCRGGKKGKKCRGKCKKAHKQRKAAKKQAKKQHKKQKKQLKKKQQKKQHKRGHKLRKCLKKCRGGKKGRKCRSRCQNDARRRAEKRAQEERRRIREARRRQREAARRQREAARRREAERRRRAEEAARAAAAAAAAAAPAPVAPAAPTTPAPAAPTPAATPAAPATPAPTSPAPTTGSAGGPASDMSPEVVITKML